MYHIKPVWSTIQGNSKQINSQQSGRTIVNLLLFENYFCVVEESYGSAARNLLLSICWLLRARFLGGDDSNRGWGLRAPVFWPVSSFWKRNQSPMHRQTKRNTFQKFKCSENHEEEQEWWDFETGLKKFDLCACCSLLSSIWHHSCVYEYSMVWYQSP